MPLALTHRRALHDRALDQHGYVTTRDCEPLGVPAVELPKLAARGGMTRVGHGVYRFDDIPASRFDGFMEAVLLVGPDAHLSHDAVLALHDLGLAVPRRLRVSTPHRVRKHLPASVEVVQRRLPADALANREGVPCTTLVQAIRDCRGLVMDERLDDVIAHARRLGLLTDTEVDHLSDDAPPRSVT